MDTPIAVVYKATWEDEKIVKGTQEVLSTNHCQLTLTLAIRN